MTCELARVSGAGRQILLASHWAGPAVSGVYAKLS